MTQLPLQLAPRMHTALTFVQSRPEAFRPGFADWLKANWSIYEAFEGEALKLYARGFRHHSARSIWHYLRHETDLREGPNEHGLKLNNNWSPCAGRLAMMMEPRLCGFFETRCSATSGALAA